jgi:Putative F0F1-ATPase subunit Ca2+/Mg2+ transporter
MDFAIQLLLMLGLGSWGGFWLAQRLDQPLWALAGMAFGLAGAFWVIFKKAQGNP